jgi:1,4-dihydroxy-6-naphthoate synthase
MEPRPVKPLRIGLSTCPNDTYAFHGLLSGAIALEPQRAVHWTLDDVEALNQAARAGALDVAKLSFATLLDLPRDWILLRSGSALGYGVGPVVLKRRGARLPERPRVAVPGLGTTAARLWSAFHPEPVELFVLRFDAIMPALEAGRADLGVCIHEGRFTYPQRGLDLVEDLGATWERATGLPLPLGGVAAHRSIGSDWIRAIDRALEHSLRLAHAAPEATLPTLRRHAAEFDDGALFEHVRLYVGEQTLRLDAAGEAAIQAFARRAGAAPLEILPEAR